ncbi:MAG: hypothetical protein INF12_14530 [Methylobacterium sp.]|nr:hypothetical protein [Methylobacterium sp.]
MSGFGTRPTSAPIPTQANRQALVDALMGVPARVGQSFQNMAAQGLQANEAFLQGEGADRPFLPSMDSGGRIGALASFLGSNMALGGPAGSLGAGPSTSGRIRAYHGSPHDFDRFDMSKIGTGEGAQAYGHGLYFAEREGVARAYRDVLSKQQGKTKAPMIDGMEAPKFANSAALRGADDEYEAARKYWDFVKSQPPGSPLSYDALNAGEATNAKLFDAFYQNVLSQRNQSGADAAAYYDALIGGADKLKNKLTENPVAGRMYEVRINADPARFLDWDKPLGQQSAAVRSGVENVLPSQSWGLPENMTGAEIWRRAMDQDSGAWGGKREMAAAMFRELGDIPGIKYLDQGSRAAGEGSRNYVVFDDKLIEILRKYGLAGLTAGGMAAAGTNANANPLAAALMGAQPQE